MRPRTRSSLVSLLGAVVLLLGVAETRAAPIPIGVWDRDDGLGGVRIATCGDRLCGDIVWLKDSGGPAFVGQKVLFDMRQTADDTWSGTARNPEDGRDYSGTMTLAGDRLITKGCLLAGLICKSVELTRAR